MRLHEFMAGNRDELLALCLEEIQKSTPADAMDTVSDGLFVFMDEIVRALRHADGLADLSPLPGKSETAVSHGRRRQREGFAITSLAFDYGSISAAVGRLGGEHGLSFDAGEYKVFNACIDNGIATSIEQYWEEARSQQMFEATERVGYLAHEIRNAVASARMALEVLKVGQVGMTSRTADVLDRSLTRTQDLVAQTMLAVRLHARAPLNPRVVDLSSLFGELVADAVPNRHVRLVMEVDERVAVEADEGLIASAISNLVQNALKFTRRGSRVLLRGGAAEDGAVFIEVEDECGGLEPGKETELFAPFVQRHGSRGGIGLGLTITREAVEAHGGQISVRNVPGKGCVFSIHLPGRARVTTPDS